jgi:hypothetical protein
LRICASSDLCRSCPTSRHRLCWSRRWWARSMRASCLLSSTRMACSPIGPATPHLASTVFVNTISAFFLLHTLHPIFVVRASLCAVQACMLSCICAYTYIFLKYIHIRIHSYIGPATRHRASTWHHTGSLSLRFSLSLSHTHTNTHMRTRHRNLASLHRLCVRCVCVCVYVRVRTCAYVYVRVRTCTYVVCMHACI